MAGLDSYTKRALLAIIWEHHYVGFNEYTSKSYAMGMANDAMHEFESKPAPELREFICKYVQ